MLPQKLILVVEDSWLNREMLVEILSGEYRVLEAEHGQQALELLAQYKDEVSLILLDVMMPVMDGYTFLDRLKEDEELSLIPVIVMTQSNSEADEVSALSHGATDFLPKPYRPQVILHRVASIINLRETAAMVNQFQYDRMTGLYSKEFFYRKAREILLQNPNERYAMIGSDIENFKLFNDMFGMNAGNQLLREMAQYCLEQVGDRGICGRIGGDQLAALCQYDGRWGEAQFTEHVAAINRMVHSTGNVAVKFGVYEINDPKVPVEYMCDRALLAADSIKGHYNKHFALYDGELRSKLLREQLITDAMETALAEEQFQVYLQPKYRLDDDRLAGAEALVRWIHPEWGFLSPGEFIPLFEKNGFIIRLDQYVWKRVCMLMRDWREKGYEPLPVSVNVSRADVYQADLPKILRDLVREHGIDPAQLHLEITESAYTENPGQLISTVEQLRSMGFVIEMDDFGSGYSSLNMLNQMKLDVLKLDMKFIQNETAKPAEQGILLFIMDLARWMSLSVVAEGVENDAQLDRLREIGCDYVQGYLFARPMPSAEYEELLKVRSAKGGVVLPEAVVQEKKMRSLLVVDEDAGYREMVRKAFQGQYYILEAEDRKSALAHIASSKRRAISVVVLSMTLPGEDSPRLLAQLRQDPMLRRTPILATMPWSEELEERALDLDADDILAKPHTPRGLRRRISHLMGMAFYQEREQVLQEEAYRDFLTGLLNRRGLHAAINGLRMEDRPVALYLFDLDNMKKANDQFGHEAGDGMLRFFSEVLQCHTRDGDILCRYGGDEFVVILKRISRLDAIMKKGHEICDSFREYTLPGEMQAACSCGIALCPREEMPSDKLIQRADEALYQAKREHKGSCHLWQE